MFQISSKENIGTTTGFIYNEEDGDGQTPQEVDQSKWLVLIWDDNPLKHKYTEVVDDWYKDPTFRVVAISW